MIRTCVGDFLTALRVNSIPIGPGDLERLRLLFARTPQLDRQTLKSLLSALLVKTPAQREVFEPLFADWCPDYDADWMPEDGREDETPTRQRLSGTPPLSALPPDEEPVVPPLQSRFSAWRLVGLVGALLTVFLIWWGWPEPLTVRGDITEHAASPRLQATDSGPDDLPAIPVDTVWFWHAIVKPEAIHVPWRLGPVELALLGLAALTAALAAWQPLPPPERDDGALVAARERRQLVWNIEHFVSDDPTRRLDLAQTVDATARAGGYVRLRFETAVYDRSVWFWLDRQLDRPTPQTAVQQLLATLAAAGLEAQQGWFTDLPDRIDWPTQADYRPAHEEGHGQQALVAICSDGEGLARRLESPLYHHASERLLRSLRHWPRLRFVDCSSSGTRLAPLLAPYGLPTIAFDDLPAWLGGVTRQERSMPLPGTDLYGDARVWAAAVALGGTQAEMASAHSSRVALGLRVSPWQVDQLLTETQQTDSRNQLINWLLRCEPLDADELLPPGSLARRALDWWRQRYRAAARRMQE